MPFFQVDDQLPVNAKIAELIEGQDGTAYQAVTLWLLAGAHCQAKLSDGLVSDGDTVRLLISKTKATKAALRLVDVGLWHAPGHDCEDCPNIEAGYVFHDWFQMRYDQGEKVKATRAVRRELKDPKIREAVKLRDGDHCRFCGRKVNWVDRKSDSGATYDHVIPGVAKGPENIVVLCFKCNRKKASRTPEQASMQLRPPPAPAETEQDLAQNQGGDLDRTQVGSRSRGVSARAGARARGRGRAGQGKGQGKESGSGSGQPPGPAGAVPDTPGRFGSPYHGWVGPPDREPDVSTCPDHGLDLPCRKCRDQ